MAKKQAQANIARRGVPVLQNVQEKPPKSPPHMDIPFSRWYEAIGSRHSRRRFESRSLSADAISHLSVFCAAFRPFPDARAVLVREPTDRVFKGLLGSYGKIKGASAFIAFLGKTASTHTDEEVGYVGEGVILEAESIGLGTCWVGGRFRPDVAGPLAGALSNEMVFCVTPVGYAKRQQSLEEIVMSGFGRYHLRKPLLSLVTGIPEDKWPHWMKPALEAARLAPSAFNRQPWRFSIEKDSITISIDSSPGRDLVVSKRLECGIAMLHIQVAALVYGIRGQWEFLEAPQVARFLF